MQNKHLGKVYIRRKISQVKLYNILLAVKVNGFTFCIYDSFNLYKILLRLDIVWNISTFYPNDTFQRNFAIFCSNHSLHDYC